MPLLHVDVCPIKKLRSMCEYMCQCANVITYNWKMLIVHQQGNGYMNYFNIHTMKYCIAL